MKLIIWTCIICIIGLGSCLESSNDINMNKISQDLGFKMISQEIKDSLIHLKTRGLISISKISAIEHESNSTLEWIMQNGKSQDFKELLYNHPNIEMKAIGVKGLIRRKDESLFKHLEYAIKQELNIQFGLTCQKLGGYFLYQLNYSSSDSLNNYFSEKEIEKLTEIVESRYFGCT